MKVIIAGSRSLKSDDCYKELITAIGQSNLNISEVVSGTAIGVDRLGEKYALVNNIKLTKMPADWNKYYKAAGVIRNKKMAEYADAAIILWDGQSPGTKNMIQNMKALDKPYYLYLVENVDV